MERRLLAYLAVSAMFMFIMLKSSTFILNVIILTLYVFFITILLEFLYKIHPQKKFVFVQCDSMAVVPLESCILLSE